MHKSLHIPKRTLLDSRLAQPFEKSSEMLRELFTLQQRAAVSMCQWRILTVKLTPARKKLWMRSCEKDRSNQEASPLLPMASTGQPSMASLQSFSSSGVAGCLKTKE